MGVPDHSTGLAVHLCRRVAVRQDRGRLRTVRLRRQWTLAGQSDRAVRFGARAAAVLAVVALFRRAAAGVAGPRPVAGPSLWHGLSVRLSPGHTGGGPDRPDRPV